MKENEIKDLVKKANCSLEFSRKITGVKFIYSKEEFENADAKSFNNRMPYCVLMKLAMRGSLFKANIDNFGCLSAARAFGITPPEKEWLSGCVSYGRGLYKDVETSKKVASNITNVKRKTYGVMAKPLEKFSEEPDVVIIVTNPYNIMRLVQGYTYTYGSYGSFKMTGLQALCSESTAYPFESNDINISALCAGTRYMAGWNKDEMALGIPYEKFVGMINGLYATVNIMEPNDDKKIIEEKMKSEGLDDFDVEYNKNYYTGVYL